MHLGNKEIADLLFRMAELLELEGSNKFRMRAYRRAAIVIANLKRPIADMIAQGEDPQDIPSIGPDLATHLKEICRTGRMKALEELECHTPREVAILSAVPGIGPKRMRILREELGINSLAALERAAAEGRIRDLPNFGRGFEAKLLEAAKRAADAPPPGR